MRQWVLRILHPVRCLFASDSAEAAGLSQTLALRIARQPERQGLPERDAKNSYLADDELETGPM